MTLFRRKQKTVPLVGVRSDVGQVRSKNEDSYGTFTGNDGECLFVVADGMGGHAAGEEASRMAVDIVQEVFFADRRSRVADRLRKALATANEQIYARSNGRQADTMGTTCTVLAISDGRAYIAHAGDSRAYQVRPEGLVQLTRDHTVASDMHAAGILTSEEAKRHPRRNALTRAIGADPEVEADVFEAQDTGPDVRYLICSDGLLLVPLQEVYEVARTLAPQEACDELVRRANQRGGPDNVTVMIIDFE